MSALGTDAARRLPAWAWLVLAGALVAVLAVVFADSGAPPAEDGAPEQPVLQAPPEEHDEPTLAEAGEIPEQAWAADLVTVELRHLGGVEAERIAPRRSGSLEGAVVDVQDGGLEGVRLTIVGGPQDGWTTVTREAGHYLFPELLPGTHYFRLDLPGAGSTTRSHRVRARGRSWRDFRVGPPVSVELLLRDHENEPLEGARVAVGLDEVQAVSDAEGKVSLPPIVGGERVLLTIRSDAHVPVRQELNLLVRPANAAPIEVPPLPLGCEVRGVVSSWPGGPYPTVSVVPRSNRIGTHRVAWETWQGVRVEADGSFTLANLPSSHLIDIRVFHPSGVAEPRLRSVRPMQTSPTRVRFVVKRGDGRVAGQVLGPDGQGINGATVVLEAADPAAMIGELYPGLEELPSTTMLPVPAALRRELKTPSSGRFDFAVGDHPAGTGSLVLTATAPGYDAERVPIRRSYSDLEVKLEPERRDASLRLERGNRARLPRVEWYLDGRPVDELDGAGLSISADGSRLSGLRSGLYDVLVRAGEDVVRHEQEFRVEPNSAVSLQSGG